jgi:hypothetical protein
MRSCIVTVMPSARYSQTSTFKGNCTRLPATPRGAVEYIEVPMGL